MKLKNGLPNEPSLILFTLRLSSAAKIQKKNNFFSSIIIFRTPRNAFKSLLENSCRSNIQSKTCPKNMVDLLSPFQILITLLGSSRPLNIVCFLSENISMISLVTITVIEIQSSISFYYNNKSIFPIQSAMIKSSLMLQSSHVGI